LIRWSIFWGIDAVAQYNDTKTKWKPSTTEIIRRHDTSFSKPRKITHEKGGFLHDVVTNEVKQPVHEQNEEEETDITRMTDVQFPSLSTSNEKHDQTVLLYVFSIDKPWSSISTRKYNISATNIGHWGMISDNTRLLLTSLGIWKAWGLIERRIIILLAYPSMIRSSKSLVKNKF
jgi:hypothetical protein